MVETAQVAPCGDDAKVLRSMYRRRALIIGIAGQDGSLLSEHLLAEGYDVFGVVRQPVSGRFDNLAGDPRHGGAVPGGRARRAFAGRRARPRCRPHEVYNLASPSFVPMSWRQPVLTAEFAAVGCTALLEAIRRVDDEIRFYQASSSEIFGEPREMPQTEETPLAPVTPYGVAKAYAHFITKSYRRRYGLHASSGILYNHESPRRPLDFVTRKISQPRPRSASGWRARFRSAISTLGATGATPATTCAPCGSWCSASRPATTSSRPVRAHSVRELVEVAFGHVDLDWDQHVRVDESLLRGKAELHDLVGDSRKAQTELDW